MKPTDLALFRSYGPPAVAPGGDVLAALSTPDLEANRYRGVLHRIHPGGSTPSDPVEFTLGPRDSAPVVSPDGKTVVFLRAGQDGPPQLHAMGLHGGEPRRMCEHPLGAGAAVFAPDGDAIAYLAAVPEAGRYGTDDDVKAEAEPPRRLTRMSYRLDGKGFVIDKAEQIFLLRLTQGAEPQQLTNEPSGAGRPAFTPDGAEIFYVRSTAVDAITEEVAVISVPSADGDAQAAVGETVAPSTGDAAVPVSDGRSVYYVGAAFTGIDVPGRTPGLWVVDREGGDVARRLTDPETVHVDALAGQPVVVGGHVLVAVADRGTVGLRAVPVTARQAPLADLPLLIGGQRVVKSFTCTGSTVVAVVAGPGRTGEVIRLDLDANGRATGPEQVLTDVSAELAAQAAPSTEITATAPDGYPVHGWLVLPAGQGPHPVLLAVHGGPYSAYTWGVFDEAQMYAAAGYAVVLPNPRGSSGYGMQHGRSIVGALGTVDADDVLALLDAALARPECDGDRVGVMGGSYGGFMTSWLASHAPGRFIAGISERAVNAWDSFAGASDIGYFFSECYVGPDRHTQWDRSPLAHADDIDIPLLIIHSEQDWRCPLEQGQRLFVALKLRGHEVEMLVFPGEGHELSRSGRPQHRRQRFDAILDWWGRYLPLD